MDLADFRQAGRAWDECHAVASIQGIVNRSGPRLYVRFVEHDDVNIDDYWLKHLTEPGGWLAGATLRPVEALTELIDAFRDDIAGAVVYDAGLPALSNIASTLAGVDNLVAIRHDETPGSVYDQLIRSGPRLPVRLELRAEDFPPGDRGSAKCAVYDWARRELIDTGRCSAEYLGYYLDAWWIDHAAQCVANHHTLTNHDYFIAQRGFFCDLNCWDDEPAVDDPRQPAGADLEALKSILHAMHRAPGGSRYAPRRRLHALGFQVHQSAAMRRNT